jgi:hypothetical protein
MRIPCSETINKKTPAMDMVVFDDSRRKVTLVEYIAVR